MMDFSTLAEKNRILEVRVGSHLFGTETEDSDLDLYGIFMPFDEIVFGSYRCEDVKFDKISKDDTGRNTKEAIDRTLTEYRKFVRLALQNNPNIIHILFADEKNIMHCDEFGRKLISIAERFPHRGAHHRFVKYAESQMHKMRIKPENYTSLVRGLEILEESNDDSVMADVSRETELLKDGPFISNDKNMRVHCGDLSMDRSLSVKKARRMISDRISKATGRSQMYLKYGFDLKFSSNLIQLLKEGIELMSTGRIVFPLEYRGEILDIKNGKYSVEQITAWAEDLMEDARVAYAKTSLPAHPRTEEIENFAMQQVKEWVIHE